MQSFCLGIFDLVDIYKGAGYQVSSQLLRTPLYEAHRRDGGKIVDFAGWEMPVEYNGIKNEHLEVRSNVGIFDLTHMGEFEVTGPDAQYFIDSLVTNDVSRIGEGQCQYTCMCRENGAIIDDLIVYRFPDTEGVPYFWLVVNASNCEKDYAWVKDHLKGDVELRNISMETALIAVQGPRAQEVLQPFTKADLEVLSYYHLTRGDFKGSGVVISRTGYTGEDGFEIYAPWDKAEAIWKALRTEAGCLPIGLGARDTLRLEAGYSLYGHEITEETNPINTSLGWVVRFTDADFIGKDALKAQKESGARTAVVGMVMQSRAIPRQGYVVENCEGKEVGVVTSGTFSPSLGRGVCLALVDAGSRSTGTELKVRVRSKLEPAVVQRPPFVRGSIRR